jgi:ribosome assembly protein RRB1
MGKGRNNRNKRNKNARSREEEDQPDRKTFEQDAMREEEATDNQRLQFEDNMPDLIEEPPVDLEQLNLQAEQEVEVALEDITEFPPLPEDEDDEDGNGGNQGQVWRRTVDGLDEDEVLEHDESAYVMYHAMNVEWPCLSFDFIRDQLGENRTRYPMSFLTVVGSQAERAKLNKITLMKLSNMGKTGGVDFDEDEMEEDDEGEDREPQLTHVNVDHYGGINRIRSMPQGNGIVACWSDTSKVELYDFSNVVQSFQDPSYSYSSKSHLRPIQSFQGHRQEGFALDWSPVEEGRLASGGGDGSIFIWNVVEGGSWAVDDSQPYLGHSGSVEDLQWSPSEPTVFLSASSDGSIAIWDTRGHEGPQLMCPGMHGGADVNVVSWNRGVSYLLASGGDDGSFKVWDLRSFSPTDTPDPLGHFTYHKQPITSIQWDYHDDSMLTVCSEDHDVTLWDLSVEVDDEEERQRRESGDPALADLPPQLLFIHQGQTDVKELRYHPQIPGLIMTTSLEGFNMFVPAIDVKEEDEEEQEGEGENEEGENEEENDEQEG